MTIDRYQAFRQLATSLGVDAIALVPGSNFCRLFNKDFHQNERPLVVVIPQHGAPAAVVPNLELGSFELIKFEGAVFDWRDQDGYQCAFDRLSNHMSINSIGVEGQSMRVFVHHAFKQANEKLLVIDAESAISGLRVLKNDSEIAAIEKAIAISELALQATIEKVAAGMSEKEIERILIQNLFGFGAENFAFTPIVAAADNSARPHAQARVDYKIKAGDALLIDFGARINGLCADITRTFFIQKCTDEAKDVYQTVLLANLEGINASLPGATAHDVDDATISFLERSDYARRIRTKTGHGVGRDIHEDPYIMRGNRTILKPGMVYTVEPGLYELGNFGVRIEDDVLITKTGVRCLTSFSKELTLVG